MDHWYKIQIWDIVKVTNVNQVEGFFFFMESNMPYDLDIWLMFYFRERKTFPRQSTISKERTKWLTTLMCEYYNTYIPWSSIHTLNLMMPTQWMVED